MFFSDALTKRFNFLRPLDVHVTHLIGQVNFPSLQFKGVYFIQDQIDNRTVSGSSQGSVAFGKNTCLIKKQNTK